jgi:hypothetical protein
MWKFIALLLLVLAPVAAAGPNNTVNITWVKPTHYTDGTPIPATLPITIKVYQMRCGSNGPEVYSGTGNGVLLRNIPVGVWCFQLVAVVEGVSSTPTPQAQATVTGLAAPTDGTLVAPTNGSIVN